uniref:Ribosomal protein L14 n=1 Tax=Cyanoptyche gloeocystis TaxID=77922 RepID=A0A096Y6X0_9EUKA|nr:ribosomal protein L14 [Cyanoptyche gloeocystis]AIM52064.1 ribosomal protein L14 [Cyanoptyche gloeocystis]
MLSKESKIKIIDNSGATLGAIVHIYKTSKAYSGSMVLISIKKTKNQKKIKKKSLQKCIVLKSVINKNHKSGIMLIFRKHGAILLNDKTKILANKIKTARDWRTQKIISILK